MKTMVELVQKLLESDLEDSSEYLDDDSGLVDQIRNKADELFITNDGKPNWGAMDEFFILTGCKVIRGEYDSFGWLTGVVVMRKGRIVYG